MQTFRDKYMLACAKWQNSLSTGSPALFANMPCAGALKEGGNSEMAYGCSLLPLKECDKISSFLGPSS